MGDEDFERVSVGSPTLDKMLGGGLIEGRPYLLTGPPSTGKSILAMRFLIEGLKLGEKVLYVTIDETPSEIKSFMQPFGWPIDSVVMLDAFPEVRSYKRASDVQEVASFGAIRIMREVKTASEQASQQEEQKSSGFKPVELSIQALQMTLKKDFEKNHYDRVVIDSLTSLRLFGMKDEDAKLNMQSLLRLLSEMEVTALLVLGPGTEAEILPERFIARGEISLFKTRFDGFTRAVRIERMRGTNHDLNARPFRISRQGIEVDLTKVVPFTEGEAHRRPDAGSPEQPAAPGAPRPAGPTVPAGPAQRKQAASIPDAALAPPKLATPPAKLDKMTPEELKERYEEMTEQLLASIEDCTESGVDVKESRLLMSKAKFQAQSGKYAKALELLYRAEELMNRRIEDFTLFSSIFQEK
jgi:circadian clock protein KaiC